MIFLTSLWLSLWKLKHTLNTSRIELFLLLLLSYTDSALQPCGNSVLARKKKPPKRKKKNLTKVLFAIHRWFCT
jgi:hypothetical protein